jgi:hypothetical protein
MDTAAAKRGVGVGKGGPELRVPNEHRGRQHGHPTDPLSNPCRAPGSHPRPVWRRLGDILGVSGCRPSFRA